MIHLNQLGFCADLPKKAVITTKGDFCFVIPADQSMKFTPEISHRFYDEASDEDVRIVDFSQIRECGQYFLFADGDKKTFYINKKPYRALTNALVKGQYYQRCGCALEEKHAGPYHHEICHTGKASLIDDSSVVMDVSGGWHDAGDYGRYIVPAAVTVGHMLYAYEFFPQVFSDKLNIPESGNDMPDILNECRYELEWMMKMQREDGGVYHKVATRFFAGFIMPQDDNDEQFLFRVSHTSTADFAACLAQAYRVFKNFNKPFAEKMLSSALKAWAWLEANPHFEPFVNPPDVSSGTYGDANLEDEIFWASCELYAATKEDRFYKSMLSHEEKADISKLGWRDVGGFGAICCLFAIKELDTKLKESIRVRFMDAAESIYALHKNSGYGTALGADGYVWGSNMPIMNNAIILICAKLLSGDDKYQEAAQMQLDYLLGMNATGYSYVTGFGEKPCRFIHNRPSYADDVDEPLPGLVSGGPNKFFPDKVCKELIPPDTPSAKFYIDHTWTASANENAIYWNSPAIFVAAYFDSLC